MVINFICINIFFASSDKEDFIMANQHDKQFKLDAIQYYLDHKELGVRGCAQNLGIGYSTLTKTSFIAEVFRR